MTDSERRYWQIFESTPVALLELDITDVGHALTRLEGGAGIGDSDPVTSDPVSAPVLAQKVKILDANRAALHLLQAEYKQDALNSMMRFLDVGESPSLFARCLAALVTGETSCEVDIDALAADGTRIPVRLTLSRLEVSEARIRALVSMVNISERRRMEAALEHAETEQERSRRELEQFIHVASHDLQEPLRMVASYAQLLSRRYADQLDERADKYIGYITDGAQRMRQFLNDLLELSRVGTRGQPLRPTDCERILSRALHGMEIQLRERCAQITYESLPAITGDESQLTQLFSHLIANGIKFAGEATPKIHISAQRRGEMWIIAVADQGIGIAPEHHETIFAAFKRLHGRSEYPGTGMGLAIAAKIVERHGGRIWVESQPTCGATFYVSLPAAPAPERQ